MKILLVDDEKLQLIRLENAVKNALPNAEIVSYTNKSVINDLLRAGYIEEVKAGDKKPAEPSKASTADKTQTANKKRTTKKEQKEG